MPSAMQPLVWVTSCCTPTCQEPCAPHSFPLKTLSREAVDTSIGVTFMWFTVRKRRAVSRGVEMKTKVTR